jgi:hypothetical protein
MRSPLKFGLIASVMMVIPTFASAQLGGLGSLLSGVLPGSSDSSSSSVEVEVCVDGLGVPLLECPPESGGSAGGGEGGLPELPVEVCVDGLGVPLLECPPGGGGGGLPELPELPPLPCLDALGVPLLNCPEGGGGGGGNGGGGNGGAGGPGGNAGGVGGNAGGAGGNAARPVDRTTVGTVRQDVVCFYVGRNFGGTPYCVGRGAVLPTLGGFNNAIRSIQFMVPGISVQVCAEENLGGTCTLVTATLPQLMGGWERQISSLRVL